MPYVKPEVRAAIRLDVPPREPGELAYKLWWEVRKYHQRTEDGYANRIQIYGIIAGLAAEWYRREVAPYEDEKIKENGDA